MSNRRPSQRTDYQIASESLNHLNRGITKIINVLRHTDLDNKHNLDGLIRALEHFDDARTKILAVRKKIQKKDRKMRKWRLMIRGFKHEGEGRKVAMPSNFFEIEDGTVIQVLEK